MQAAEAILATPNESAFSSEEKLNISHSSLLTSTRKGTQESAVCTGEVACNSSCSGSGGDDELGCENGDGYDYNKGLDEDEDYGDDDIGLHCPLCGDSSPDCRLGEGQSTCDSSNELKTDGADLPLNKDLTNTASKTHGERGRDTRADLSGAGLGESLSGVPDCVFDSIDVLKVDPLPLIISSADVVRAAAICLSGAEAAMIVCSQSEEERIFKESSFGESSKDSSDTVLDEIGSFVTATSSSIEVVSSSRENEYGSRENECGSRVNEYGSRVNEYGSRENEYGSRENEDGMWSCTRCTMLNAVALSKCEICEMVRCGSDGRPYGADLRQSDGRLYGADLSQSESADHAVWSCALCTCLNPGKLRLLHPKHIRTLPPMPCLVFSP